MEKLGRVEKVEKVGEEVGKSRRKSEKVLLTRILKYVLFTPLRTRLSFHLQGSR